MAKDMNRSAVRLAVLQKRASLHKTAGIKDTLIGASDGTYTRPGFIPKLLANKE